MESNYRRKLKQEEKVSGAEVERTWVFIMEKNVAEKLWPEGKLKKVTDEADKVNAVDIRKKAMGNLGKTKRGRKLKVE